MTIDLEQKKSLFAFFLQNIAYISKKMRIFAPIFVRVRIVRIHNKNKN